MERTAAILSSDDEFRIAREILRTRTGFDQRSPTIDRVVNAIMLTGSDISREGLALLEEGLMGSDKTLFINMKIVASRLMVVGNTSTLEVVIPIIKKAQKRLYDVGKHATQNANYFGKLLRIGRVSKIG